VCLLIHTVFISFDLLHAVNIPVPLTDAGCNVGYWVANWSNMVIEAILGVIFITRLHAMYQRSRKILVFVSVIFLVVQIFCAVTAITIPKLISGGEFVFDGIHMCGYAMEGEFIVLAEIGWILLSAWEVLALCLAIWISVIHIRELRQASTGWVVGDCFAILIRTHVFYFASFLTISCLRLATFSPKFTNNISLGTVIFNSLIEIVIPVQTFVLGSRLILSVRDYHTKLVANSDDGTAMTTINFREPMQV